MLENIPAELRDRRQWICWRYTEREGKQTKVPYNVVTGLEADVTKPANWFSFFDTVAALNTGYYSGIGFCLTADDPYAFIDLDVPKCPQDQIAAEYARQELICSAFNSYSERSPSGNGLHIIVRASIPSGVKRSKSGVEMYSSARYMTMTGNVFNNAPIEERNELFNQLYTELVSATPQIGDVVDNAETRTDADVVLAALNASNGEKFRSLLRGEWATDYPSQSEADQAFVNMVAFYSRNQEQTSRIWLASPLGDRPKASRPDYRSSTVKRAFDQMIKDVDCTAIMESTKAIVKSRSLQTQQSSETDFGFPPGMLGEVAQFILEAAPYPVPNIALAGAIGFMSGLLGRAYNVGGVGVNTYTFLLGPTSSGKEAMASGIAKILEAVSVTVPSIRDYFGIDHIASGQSLYKVLNNRNCFLSLQAEAGQTFRELTDANTSDHMRRLKQAYLDLYTKSGKGQILGESVFADKSKNTGTLQSPSVSLLMESVADVVYNAMDDEMLRDGFLARFLLIEIDSARLDHNKNTGQAKLSHDLTARIAALCVAVSGFNLRNDVIDVKFTQDAANFDEEYRSDCRKKSINDTVEGVKQLWTRAHLKARKLAALAAIGINTTQPVITLECLKWAIAIVNDGITRLSNKFQNGEVGGGDSRQMADMRDVLIKYLNKDAGKLAREGGKAVLQQKDGVISHAALSRRCMSIRSFRTGQGGATQSLWRTIKLFTDAGYLIELPEQRARKYGLSGKVYAINLDV